MTTATLIMYYQERFKAKEMHNVCAIMGDAYEKVINSAEDGHGALIEWGKVIRRKFDLDNLRLRARKDHGELEQIVTSINSLGSTFTSMYSLLSDLSTRVITIEGDMRDLKAQLAELSIAAPSPMAAPSPTAVPRHSPARPAAPPPPPPPPPPGGTAPPPPAPPPG